MAVDLLVRMMSPRAAADDERMWGDSSGLINTGSGMRVTYETAMRISAYFACLRVLGETVLSTPLSVYRRLPNGDRELASDSHLYRLLHDDEPNETQTSGEWMETHTIATAARGTSYSRIRPGPDGPVSSLEYTPYERVTPERLPNGLLRYRHRPETGPEEIVSAERMFRLPGISDNGVTGLGVLEYARESLGISLALQRYASRSFAQGVRTSGVLETAGDLSDEAYARLRRDWTATYEGANNTGKTVILENGLTYKGISMTNDDAQMLGSEQWQVVDVARWFRMPLIMIQEHEKSTSWGSGVEHQQIGFVMFTMLPWFMRWERRLNKQLVRPLYGSEYFCEFTIENLLRGDMKSRVDAYNKAINDGWLTRNEVRRRENLNAGPAPLDEFLQPAYLGVAGESDEADGNAGKPPGGEVDPRLRSLASVMVGQIVRKETEAIRKAAVRFADDGIGWQEWAGEFYGQLAEDLSERQLLPAPLASEYVERQKAALLERGAAVAESRAEDRADDLLRLVLEAGK